MSNLPVRTRDRRMVLLIVVLAGCGSSRNERSPGPESGPTAGSAASQGAMMSTLDKAARMPLDEYNPDLVIDAVNALQPLGKQKALDAIKAYLAKAGNAGNAAVGLFWVLRTSFDLPAGQAFPPVRLGQPDVPPPASPDALPRFPIVVARDEPLLVVRGYALGGFPEPVTAH